MLEQLSDPCDQSAGPCLAFHKAMGYWMCVATLNETTTLRDLNNGSVKTLDLKAQAPVSAPPVLSPQRDVPIIRRDHPPVLTSQFRNPGKIQNPSRSLRIKSKPQRLHIIGLRL